MTSELNAGAFLMNNGLTRLQSRFLLSRKRLMKCWLIKARSTQKLRRKWDW